MRIVLGVSYNGQGYQGWQSQSSGLTIQDKLEHALGKFTAQRVSTLCAGRTDAGVHGLMQVVHFDTLLERDTYSWIRGTNANLPKDIAVQWAVQTTTDFHCRASALSRRYAYVLLESQIRPSVESGRVGWTFNTLNEAAMRQAADFLVGEHDFSSFRAAQCQALSPVKNLMRIELHKRGAYWRIEFEGLMAIAEALRNKKPPEWMAEVLAARNRKVAAPTFSPDGLYFLGPRYDPQWGIPDRTPAYDALP